MIVTESGIFASQMVLPKAGEMTRGSILEYVEAIRDRYLASSREGKEEFLVQKRACSMSPTLDVAEYVEWGRISACIDGNL